MREHLVSMGDLIVCPVASDGSDRTVILIIFRVRQGCKYYSAKSVGLNVRDGADVRRAPERARRTRASVGPMFVRVSLACSACEKVASMRVLIATGVSVRDGSDVRSAPERARQTHACQPCFYPPAKTDLVLFMRVGRERELSRAFSRSST